MRNQICFPGVIRVGLRLVQSPHINGKRIMYSEEQNKPPIKLYKEQSKDINYSAIHKRHYHSLGGWSQI